MSSAIVANLTKQYSGFTPTSIPGCSLWLDAADSSSITFSSGSNINVWSDKSGNGRNATQYNTGYATYNSTQKRVVITTTGQLSSSIPAGTFSGGISAFLVFQKYGAATGSDTLINRTNQNIASPFDNYYLGAGSYTTRNVAGGDVNNRANFNDSANFFLNTTTTLYYFNIPANVSWNEGINGSPPTSITQTETVGTPVYGDNATALYIGTRQNKQTTANVYIYEILLYNFTLTTSQRQQLEGYLALKWGLTANLPATHPFKTTPLYTRIFQPTDIDGCSLWLDAADSSTFTLTGSTLVSITDKSTAGRVITVTNAPTYSATSFNSKYPAFTFTTANMLTSSLATAIGTGDCCFAAVMNNTGTAGQNSVLSVGVPGGTTEMAMGWNNGESRYKFYQYGTGQGVYTASNGINTSIIGTRLSSTMSVYINGNDPNSTGAATTNNTNTAVYIGSNTGFTFAGQICEIILYVGTLTTYQIKQLQGYLNWKWGLRSSLPSTHPFKLYPTLTTIFNPLQVSGCSLWLDGIDPNGNGSKPANGSTLSTWVDKSGNVNNATTGTSSPTWISDYSLNFNGTNQNLLFTNATNLAVNKSFIFFVVEKRQSGTTTLLLSGSSQLANQNLLFGYVNGNAYYDFNGSGNSGTSLTMPAFLGSSEPVRLWTCIYNGTQRIISLNGGTSSSTQSYTQNLTSWTNASIGRTYAGTIYDSYWMNKCYEIIFYNSITTLQRQQVEGYLAWKWGLQGSLPSTHPFKKFAP